MWEILGSHELTTLNYETDAPPIELTWPAALFSFPFFLFVLEQVFFCAQLSSGIGNWAEHVVIKEEAPKTGEKNNQYDVYTLKIRTKFKQNCKIQFDWKKPLEEKDRGGRVRGRLRLFYGEIMVKSPKPISLQKAYESANLRWAFKVSISAFAREELYERRDRRRER